MCGHTHFIWTVCGHDSHEFEACGIKKYHGRKDWLKWLTTLLCAIPDCPSPRYDADSQFIYGFCPKCRKHYLEGDNHELSWVAGRPEPKELRNSVAFMNYWMYRHKQLPDEPDEYRYSPGVHPVFVFRNLDSGKPRQIPDVDAEIRQIETWLPWHPEGDNLYDERLAYLTILRKLTLRWADELSGKDVDKLYPLTTTEWTVMNGGPELYGSRQPRRFSELHGCLHGFVVSKQPPTQPEQPVQLPQATVYRPRRLPAAHPSGAPTLEDWQARINRDHDELSSLTPTTTTERSTPSPSETLDMASSPLPSPTGFEIPDSPISESSASSTQPSPSSSPSFSKVYTTREHDVAYELEDIAL